MQLSVIILNFNVQYFLEICISSVQKSIQNINAEIIVVDNNSNDASCEMVKKLFPNVILIENKTNLGFPKGNNIGVNHASGEFICILNPDTIVSENTFEKVLQFAQSKSNLGIIGCQLIDGSGNFLPESKRGIPTPWVAFTKIVGLYKIFPNSTYFNQYYAQNLSKDQTDKVAILVGAFMVMKRQLYQQLQGFDEDCFMYSDDIDLSYRALKMGLTNYYFHETTIIHFKGESTIKDQKYLKRFQEAMNYFYKKHFKVSGIFSAFMLVGIYFFSLFKKFQGKQKPKVNPSNYVFVSNSEIDFIEVQKKIKKNLHIMSFDDLHNNTVLTNSEIIFDTSQITFKDQIEFMQNNQNLHYTYKFYSSKSNFMLGSNSSNDRGEIVLF